MLAFGASGIERRMGAHYRGSMINGVHALIYAHDAPKVRAFFRDILKWPYVDAHEGWLIFAMPPSEVGVHPIMQGDTYSHQLYFMCKDVHKVVAKLEKLGFQCGPVRDQGFGLLTSFELPGAGPMGMYQPRHPIAAGMTAKPGKTGRKAGGSKKKQPKKQIKARRVSGGANQGFHRRKMNCPTAYAAGWDLVSPVRDTDAARFGITLCAGPFSSRLGAVD
jgi:hypothetical protein